MEENKLANINFTEVKGNPSIKSDNNVFSESFYFSKFYEEKAYKRFITNTERLIRSSREYKKYIELLRTNVSALNIDNILTNITNADAELEFHHYPFTLFDVVDIVSIDKFLKKEKISSFKIAKEVMRLHYENLIGLVPLSKMNHELAHNGSLFISSKQVFGDYKQFLKTYDAAVSNEIKESIKKMEELTRDNSPSDTKGLF
jgi:hypothetical protein